MYLFSKSSHPWYLFYTRHFMRTETKIKIFYSSVASLPTRSFYMPEYYRLCLQLSTWVRDDPLSVRTGLGMTLLTCRMQKSCYLCCREIYEWSIWKLFCHVWDFQEHPEYKYLQPMVSCAIERQQHILLFIGCDQTATKCGVMNIRT